MTFGIPKNIQKVQQLGISWNSIESLYIKNRIIRLTIFGLPTQILYFASQEDRDFTEIESGKTYLATVTGVDLDVWKIRQHLV